MGVCLCSHLQGSSFLTPFPSSSHCLAAILRRKQLSPLVPQPPASWVLQFSASIPDDAAWNGVGFLSVSSAGGRLCQCRGKEFICNKILCAMCNYICIMMNSIDTEMSAGFESCDPYTGNKNIQNFCSTCTCIKSNSKPSCSETQVKPFRSGGNVSGEVLPCLLQVSQRLPLKRLALALWRGKTDDLLCGSPSEKEAPGDQVWSLNGAVS